MEVCEDTKGFAMKLEPALTITEVGREEEEMEEVEEVEEEEETDEVVDKEEGDLVETSTTLRRIGMPSPRTLNLNRIPGVELEGRMDLKGLDDFRFWEREG